MLNVLTVLILISQANPTSGESVNSELANVLVSSLTSEALGETVTPWRERAHKSAAEFDNIVDRFASNTKPSSVLLEDELAAIGRDRKKHPEKYEEIDRIFKHAKSDPRQHAQRPPYPDKKYLTSEYRYVWEYFFLRPQDGEGIQRFDSLCITCVENIRGKDANVFFRDFGLTIASTNQVGGGINQLLPSAYGPIIGQPSIASLKCLLELGAVWDRRHLGESAGHGINYEDQLAQYLSLPAYRNPRTYLSWAEVWGKVNSLKLSDEELAVVNRIKKYIAKWEALRESRVSHASPY